MSLVSPLSSSRVSSLVSSVHLSRFFSCLRLFLSFLFLSSLFLSFLSFLFFSFLFFSFLFFSCLVLSCLLFSFLVLSCLSFSVSVWCCVVLCGVVLCCVVLCGVVLCCVCGVVWCGVWLGTQKKPCVDSKRPRVYRHHAHMWYHLCAWCRYTRGRFESTHGGFLDGHTGERREGGGGGEGREGHRQFCSPKFAHKLLRVSERFTERNPWFFPIQGLRTGREQHVPESSNHSLYLMELLRDTAEGISTHNTHIRTNTYSPTHPTHRPTHHRSPPLPPLPLPHAHAHANAHVHARVYVHARVLVYVCAYVDVYAFVCVCVYVYDLPQWFHVCATSLYLHMYKYFYVIMTRDGRHNIRNGIAWAQTGHGTFTRTHQKFESFRKKFATTIFEFESVN